MKISNDPRGSLWHKWDLHFHTPASFDYLAPSVTNKQIVDRLIAEDVSVVAITDHHTMDVNRILELQCLAGDQLTVLPGIELRSELGGKPIHYILLFSEESDVAFIWDRLRVKLQLDPSDVSKKGGDEKIYVKLADASKLARELGGLVSIHAGEKSNSIEEIKNREQFQQRLKFDIIKDDVDILEIGQIRDIDTHLNVIFPSIGLDKPMILGSDCHDINNYFIKASNWIRADPTFRGLKMFIREPRSRGFIGRRPEDLIRQERESGKIIERLEFSTRQSEVCGWFSSVDIRFNPGLVAVIGNKGSGKSALSDTLGLLASCRNYSAFSFLTGGRFCDPRTRLAEQFEATLTWASGERVTKGLEQSVEPHELERIQYLPQNHVEALCNEVANQGAGSRFEKELKSVIFSHVPYDLRYGLDSFESLLRSKTEEKSNRINALIGSLRSATRLRVEIEEKTDPLVRERLLERIVHREKELELHVGNRPAVVQNPAPIEGRQTAEQKSLLEQLSAIAERKAVEETRKDGLQASLRNAQFKKNSADQLLQRVENFKKQYEEFKRSIAGLASELGLDCDSIVIFVLQDEVVKRVISEQSRTIEHFTSEIANLESMLKEMEEQEFKFKSKLNEPQRLYQAYVEEFAKWEKRHLEIVGSPQDFDSLQGLQHQLASLAKLPEELERARLGQAWLTEQIYCEKLGQVAVYQELYGPIREFMRDHEMKDLLNLEFTAELVAPSFGERFLSLISQSKRGTFMGTDEGQTRVDDLVDATDWQNLDSVLDFLVRLENALHHDLRDSNAPPVQLKEQLRKASTAEDVYNLLYGLDYIRPTYALRWSNRDLAQLSPGERGILLLVFYLLIDRSDTPLVVDQPEENLDNHTVTKVLVECIRIARKRRQIVIVTHNPNLAVVCDADQVISASIDKANQDLVTYRTGSIENPGITPLLTDTLEGTRQAFGIRDSKYKIGEELRGH